MEDEKNVIIPKELQNQPIVKDVRVKIYFCRNCFKWFKPKFFQKNLMGNERKLLEEPERCGKCNSRWWKIWKKDRVICQRCGYNIDQSKYTGNLPKYCPMCGKSKYLQRHYASYLNYSKEVRDKFKKDYREFMKKNKPKVVKFTSRDLKPSIEFVKNIADLEDKIEDRLL